MIFFVVAALVVGWVAVVQPPVITNHLWHAYRRLFEYR